MRPGGPSPVNSGTMSRRPEGRFYYARDAGPLHLIVLDTGEDKPDDTRVYAELNSTVEYRAQELAWFKNHVKTDPRVAEAPFRVILMHQPGMGLAGRRAGGVGETANEAGVDLVIAGHRHRFVVHAAGAGCGPRVPSAGPGPGPGGQGGCDGSRS